MADDTISEQVDALEKRIRSLEAENERLRRAVDANDASADPPVTRRQALAGLAGAGAMLGSAAAPAAAAGSDDPYAAPEGVVIWNDDDAVYVDGPTDGESGQFDTLPDATDFAFSNSQQVTVAEGRYFYSKDVVIPDRSHLHLDRVILDPEGCHGLRIGDGEHETVQTRITGYGQIKPDSWGEKAESCIYVHGAKLVTVNAKLRLDRGTQNAALDIDGGDTGSWWNYFRGLYVKGRLHKHTTGSTPANAQTFSGCTFKGQIDVDAGNSLRIANSWFSTIRDGQTIDVGSGTYISGRIEACDVVVPDGSDDVTINAQRFENSTINGETDLDNVDTGAFNSVQLTGMGFVDGPEFSERKYAGTHDTTPWHFVQNAAYTADDEAVLEVESSYPGSGSGDARNNVIRAVAENEDDRGYFLRGVLEGATDKDLEVGGDFVNEADGRGLVVRTPDGGDRYRIRVDDDGDLVTERA